MFCVGSSFYKVKVSIVPRALQNANSTTKLRHWRENGMDQCSVGLDGIQWHSVALWHSKLCIFSVDWHSILRVLYPTPIDSLFFCYASYYRHVWCWYEPLNSAINNIKIAWFRVDSSVIILQCRLMPKFSSIVVFFLCLVFGASC